MPYHLQCMKPHRRLADQVSILAPFLDCWETLRWWTRWRTPASSSAPVPQARSLEVLAGMKMHGVSWPGSAASLEQESQSDGSSLIRQHRGRSASSTATCRSDGTIALQQTGSDQATTLPGKQSAQSRSSA